MTYTIGDVSRLTGLSVPTLRYYEEQGLLPDVQRAANGHRVYTDDDVSWIEILQCLRATEMPVARIKRFTELMQQGTRSEAERLRLLEAHRCDVEEHLEMIRQALVRIDEKIDYYRSAVTTDPSPAD